MFGCLTCPQTFVSETAAPPPPGRASQASRTRVPKSTSHNHRCQRVVRRSPPWDICSGMSASPPPTSSHSSRSTPWSAPGCYRVFTETASSTRTDRPILEQLLDQLRPGDTLVVWKLDRLGRSLRHLVDTITTLAERGVGFRSLQEAIDTHHPRRQTRLPRLRRPGRVRTRPHPRTHGRRAGGGPGPRPPRRPALSSDRPQAPSGPGDVCLRAVHGGHDRQDPGGQPGLDLPPPHQHRRVTTGPIRAPGYPPCLRQPRNH